MSDALSHHSSGLEYLEEENIDEASDYDEISIASESVISARQLATDPDYAVIWELLHSCQDAALSDMPERYHECLSTFDTKHRGFESGSMIIQSGKEDEAYDRILKAAGATIIYEPWSLPAVTRYLSPEDALWPPNARVLNVAQVTPMAAMYLRPDAALVATNNQFGQTSEATASTPITKETSKSLESSASPLVHATEPLFASAVFTSESQISHRRERLSFHTLRRYNRLAVTSLLRQAHCFNIDVPVFGVLLKGDLVAFHVDWYEERDGVMSNSAFYTLDDQQAELKIWNLRQPADARDVGIILENLRGYTTGPYACQVRKALKTVKGPIIPWKWDASRLPEVLTSSPLQPHSVEPDQDKMDRWLAGIHISMEHEKRGAWLRRKWDAERLEDHDILSPPSTPESPEKLRT